MTNKLININLIDTTVFRLDNIYYKAVLRPQSQPILSEFRRTNFVKKFWIVAILSCVVIAGAGALITSIANAQTACPCSVFGPASVPALENANDPAAVTLGMRFRSDVDGYITGVRFYKGSLNTGVHTGVLWTNTGTSLASVTFASESASGWQQADFGNPVAITANTTYVISYHTTSGYYSFTGQGFAASVDNAPLHGLADGLDGSNGLFRYGSTASFPDQSFNAANYWVDVVFSETIAPDTTPPTVVSTSPAANGSNFPTSSNITATFSENIDASTATSATFELRDAANNLVPAAVSAGGSAVVLNPNSPLDPQSTYTANLKGGAADPRIKDIAGNPLAADHSWSFTTGAPGPEQGPGGPILVVASSANQFSWYYAEILRAEGYNEFTTRDLSTVTPQLLASYDVVIVGDLSLTADQVTTFSDWANAGGNLILMSPDKQLAGLIGVTDQNATLADRYLLVNTASGPGAGIVGQTIQYHGPADLYTLNGATSVANIYSDAATATANPAVTIRNLGVNGGQVAAFTYDLARSVVYTRQGNPAWAGQERDNDGSGIIRSDDLFFGASPTDPQPDYVDLNKVAIPQAEEQQRLLGNLITQMNLDKKPLPHFWYMPDDRKAVIVHALDDHATANATKDTFDALNAASPANCSVNDWDCYRATSWLYTQPSVFTNEQAVAYHQQGHDIGIHINSGCSNFTSTTQLDASFANELSGFQAAYPGLPAQRGNRTHCIPWSDWDSEAIVEANHGIRYDMNYYYWPGSWVQNRPGYFTGAGLPQRFARLDGTMIDVYQAPSQVVNENGQSYPEATNAMLDKALGPEGYYGVLGTHDDFSGGNGFLNGIIGSAQSRGVAIVSAEQMLTWLDARNASSFSNIAWAGNSTLSFNVNAAVGANNLSAVVPMQSAVGTLQTITRGGSNIAFTTQTIKGISYAFFAAPSGSYVATYSVPAPERFTVFQPDSTPATLTDSDTAAVELGMKFRSDLAGTVTGVRFYKGPQNTGTHVGSLWSRTGTLLGRVTFANETASGWQEAVFSAPITIAANTTYVISYRAPNSRYSVNENFFASSGTDNGPLHGLRAGVDGANGVYRYTASSLFPNQSYNASNYWVDVVFSPTAPDTSAPTAPSNLTANAVSATQINLSWTASSDNVGVAKYQVFRDGGATPIAEPTTTSFTDAVLPATTYSYTVKAVDAAGNISAASNTATATTPAAPTSYSLFSASSVPAAPSDPDTAAVELGVKFTSSQNGSITGIRFYKGAGNTGTHIGKLWSSTGTLLASATFTGETASGWQQVNFASPVAVTAGTIYVASYLAPNGRYAGDVNFFTNSVTNGPLTAPSSASSGGNGVYRYGASGGFPNNTWQAANYWVDVVFIPN